MKGDPRDGGRPPPELEALDYFVGIWGYKGRLEAHRDEAARDVNGTLICRWELGKHFLGIAEDDEQTLSHPRRRQARAYWGYDAGAKLYTCAVFYYGGGRFIAGSPGWRSDVLTFAGELSAGGERVAMRQSFNQKSDDDMIVQVDLVDPAGDPIRSLAQRCRREGDG